MTENKTQETNLQIHPRCDDRPLWRKVAERFASCQFAWISANEIDLTGAQLQGLKQVGILQIVQDQVGLTDQARKMLYR